MIMPFSSFNQENIYIVYTYATKYLHLLETYIEQIENRIVKDVLIRLMCEKKSSVIYDYETILYR